MFHSSIRNIFFTILASLLLNRAATQKNINPFLAASVARTVPKLPVSYPRIHGGIPTVSKASASTKPLRVWSMSWQAPAYTASLAWTCRQELRVEKILTVPVKLSLGSREQVDWLEGKHR